MGGWRGKSDEKQMDPECILKVTQTELVDGVRGGGWGQEEEWRMTRKYLAWDSKSVAELFSEMENTGGG